MSRPRAPQNRSAAFVCALGAVVRARRLLLKQTYADLARLSGLSESAIYNVEAGDPSLDLLQLVAIAGALEIPVRNLLKRAERKSHWRGKAGTTASRIKRRKKPGRRS